MGRISPHFLKVVIMLNIDSILIYIYNGVRSKDPRFVVLDDEHVLCTLTGVEFHLYDNAGKVTHGDNVVALIDQFNPRQKQMLFDIKKLISDPKVLAEKEIKFRAQADEAMALFSDLFENPRQPEKTEDSSGENTTMYKG